MPNPNKIGVAERANLEKLHNMLQETTPAGVPEEVYASADTEKREEQEYHDKKAEESIDASEKDKKIRELELQMQQMQETVAKLVAGGLATPAEAASMLTARDLTMQRRRLYDRIRRHGNKCRIVLHSSDNRALNKPVYVGVNGSGRYLERAKTVVVTAEELEVLDNAVYEAEENIVDPSGNVTKVHNVIPSYPYSLQDFIGAEG